MGGLGEEGAGEEGGLGGGGGGGRWLGGLGGVRAAGNEWGGEPGETCNRVCDPCDYLPVCVLHTPAGAHRGVLSQVSSCWKGWGAGAKPVGEGK